MASVGGVGCSVMTRGAAALTVAVIDNTDTTRTDATGLPVLVVPQSWI